MKVKCKICGRSGFIDTSRITEFWASRFIRLHISVKKDFVHPANSKFICRRWVNAVLDALKMESCRIDDLYKPEISKPKEVKKHGKVEKK